MTRNSDARAGKSTGGPAAGRRRRIPARAGRGRAARSLEGRIQQHYEALSPAERRLADLILNFPGQVAAYSATELARLAGVSKAAATRLFQRLGYASYEEARRHARDAQRWGSPLYLQTGAGVTERPAAALEAQLQCDVANLARTLERIDAGAVAEMTKAVARARRVFVLGFRNSHMLAAYARWQLIQVRGDVLLLPAGGETLGEYAAWLGPEDLLVAVGIRRRVPMLRRFMQAARDSGARILYITDPTASRSARLATWTVRCEVRGASLFDSYVAVISVLHFLCSAVVGRAGARGRSRLERIERLHEQLGEF